MSARSVALVALERIENGAYSNLVLPALLRGTGLDARDRAFATDLVYGTVRRRRALDFLLTPRSSQALARLEPVVRAGLRMGAYQLVDGVPAHAAVGETVSAVAGIAPAARGYVNGVLRAVARAGPPWPWPDGNEVDALGVRYSQPDWIVSMLLAQFGEVTARAVMATADRAPGVTLRVNPRRATADSVEAELVTLGVRLERGRLVPDALVATGLGDVGALGAVRDGRATPQDQASQAIARLVAASLPLPREGARCRVLDIAAAPGGKTTAIAELTDDVLVVAGDVNGSRVARVGIAAARLALPGVALMVADGRRLPLRPASFDAVLLDAPCTGLGVLRHWADGVAELAARGIVPGLAVILVGEHPASSVYVASKGAAAREAGIAERTLRFPAGLSESEILATVDLLNHDDAVETHSVASAATTKGMPSPRQ